MIYMRGDGLPDHTFKLMCNALGIDPEAVVTISLPAEIEGEDLTVIGPSALGNKPVGAKSITYLDPDLVLGNANWDPEEAAKNGIYL